MKKYNDYSRFYTSYALDKLINQDVQKYYYRYIVVCISNPCMVIKRAIQRYFRKVFHKNILFIFAIGTSKYVHMVYYETITFKDILSINIRNNYFNITYIFLKCIYWINNNYYYDFIIKWDDDIFVNIPLLLLFINIQIKNIHYCGYVYNKTNICRYKNKICYVPYFVYSYTYLPSFAASGLLILSKYASQYINNFNRRFKIFMIRDDQFIGVLLYYKSIQPLSLNRYYIRFRIAKNKTKNIILYHTNDINELFCLYKKIFMQS